MESKEQKYLDALLKIEQRLDDERKLERLDDERKLGGGISSPAALGLRQDLEAILRETFVSDQRHGEVANLTAREVEILKKVAEGQSNADIATSLWVTEQTVKFHLSNVYRKLGVANRTQAAVRFGSGAGQFEAAVSFESVGNPPAALPG
jgi:DNA-binding CsgD family transcriptional regulator